MKSLAAALLLAGVLMTNALHGACKTDCKGYDGPGGPMYDGPGGPLIFGAGRILLRGSRRR